MEMTDLTFEDFTLGDSFVTSELSVRAESLRAWAYREKQFRVRLAGEEAAFVAFDLIYPGQLNLYE